MRYSKSSSPVECKKYLQNIALPQKGIVVGMYRGNWKGGNERSSLKHTYLWNSQKNEMGKSPVKILLDMTWLMES